MTETQNPPMPSKKILPSEVTSYDVLKSLAVLLMIIDHMGFFFFKDLEILRAIGRASFPIWGFLIGYAYSRDLPVMMWLGAGILIASGFVMGGDFLPLNMLVTILITRMILDRMVKIIFKDWETALFGSFALAVLWVPSMIMFDYGSLAFLFALTGFLFRHWDTVNLSNYAKYMFIGFVLLFYALTQLWTFSFDPEIGKFMVVIVFFSGVCCYMFAHNDVILSIRWQILPDLVKSSFKFMGRHSLEIYVGHLILFKFLALIMGIEGYSWFPILFDSSLATEALGSSSLSNSEPVR